MSLNELFQSIERVERFTIIVLHLMILYYAFPLWRRTKHRFLLCFCLSSLIAILITIGWIFWDWLINVTDRSDIILPTLWSGPSISNIFAGFAIYWMVQHYRRPPVPPAGQNPSQDAPH